LVLDFKALNTPTEDAVDLFVDALVDRIAELPMIHGWRGFALAMSSFPMTNKLKPGQVGEYPRIDLMVYQKLISDPRELLRTPMFGDYALDTSPMQKPERRTPSAHFR
jgi:Beta protein